MVKGTEEQNLAAGGNTKRLLRILNGKIVTVSVAVRNTPKNAKNKYAYMHYKTESKTFTKYIGPVGGSTHLESIAIGWKFLREKKIIESLNYQWVEED